jgi:tol-pal system protein YbgF
MKFTPFALATWLLLTICTLLLLSGCAPAPAGPSTALRQQFETIIEQQQQQAEQLQALQAQLAQLQMQMSSGTATATQIEPIPEPAPAPDTVVDTPKIPVYVNTEISDLADSAATYLAAFSNLAAGRFAPAEAGFDLFLREYPKHQYTPNARYWLANAQAAQNNLQAAMSNLRQIIVAGDGRQKAPAALVLLAQLYRRQDLPTEADEVLEQLRSRYPDSPEAQHFYQSDEPR